MHPNLSPVVEHRSDCSLHNRSMTREPDWQMVKFYRFLTWCTLPLLALGAAYMALTGELTAGLVTALIGLLAFGGLRLSQSMTPKD
jgi:hypothetical protein